MSKPTPAEVESPWFRVALLEPEEGDVYRQVVIIAVDPTGTEGPNTGAGSSIRWMGDCVSAEDLAYTLRRVSRRGLRLDQRDLPRQHDEKKARERRQVEKKGGTE